MVKIVFYDLETTGGGRNRDHEIIQISAKYNDLEFETIIYPFGPISARATAFHGLSKDGQRQQLVFEGDLLDTVSPVEGFQEFLDFLERISRIGPSRRVILCSHNNKNFDSVHLQRGLGRESMALPDYVKYVDSIEIAETYKDGRNPNLASMSLNDCLEEFGRSQSQPHNAMEDAENLQFLCREMSKRLGYKNYQTYLHFNRDEIF